MENLIKRLQTEAGLTEEQAHKAWEVICDFMDKEGMSIDWSKYFKNKYDDFKDQAKDFVADVSDKAETISNKVSDKVIDVSLQAKRMARDFSKKMYDELNDELSKSDKK